MVDNICKYKLSLLPKVFNRVLAKVAVVGRIFNANAAPRRIALDVAVDLPAPSRPLANARL